jgi:hypothetical protein
VVVETAALIRQPLRLLLERQILVAVVVQAVQGI